MEGCLWQIKRIYMCSTSFIFGCGIISTVIGIITEMPKFAIRGMWNFGGTPTHIHWGWRGGGRSEPGDDQENRCPSDFPLHSPKSPRVIARFLPLPSPPTSPPPPPAPPITICCLVVVAAAVVPGGAAASRTASFASLSSNEQINAQLGHRSALLPLP